nr:hypothetical protein [Tanacetum cinerariifolium]
MRKKKNDVKARTTLLLSLLDEHQLRFRRRDNYRQGSKAEEQAPKALMAINRVGWDWSYMENDEEDHALVADEVAPAEFALMANTSAESKVFDNSLCSKDCKKNNDSLNKTLKEEKEGVDGKLAGLLKASKDLDNLIESQRSDKIKDGLGYSAVPPPPAQLYLSSKKDLSWTGLLECANDTVTNNSRPSPTVESTSGDDQNRNPPVYETVASPITPKPFIKFMKPKDSQSKSKSGKFEEKEDEGYFIGYSMSSKAFRVFNKRTRRVEENFHVEFLENKAIEKGTISSNLSGIKDVASQEVKKNVSSLRYIAFPNWAHNALLEHSSSKPQDHYNTKVPEGSGNFNPTASTSNPLADLIETLTVETPIPTASSSVPTPYSTDSQEPSNILRVSSNSKEANGVEADISNMEIAITASPTPTHRIHKDNPKSQIIGPVNTPIQTRNKSKENVWSLVDCPKGVRPIGIKWVLKNKKDIRGIVIRNKARLVAQGHTQEEGIDYDEVFAHVARIEAIRLFLAYASFMGFTPLGFQDPESLAKVYKVEKAIEFEALMYEKFQISAMGELNFFLGLQVLQKEDGIFLSQDKYVGDILKKFEYSNVRSSSTPMDKDNPWGKDRTGKDVDLHLYRSMIGSLMYLTASRPDIMFAVCACARHQVTPKECHLHAVKRIFRYLKGHPKLVLWYPKESPFDFVAYSDSYYGGATQDRKSTTGGCQFLGRRLISWECKKQTIMATSTTKAEYVAAASCCGKVLWIQYQLLDYGDCFEKKLTNMDHIHTNENVADLLTKPFDAGRFQYLVVEHAM